MGENPRYVYNVGVHLLISQNQIKKIKTAADILKRYSFANLNKIDFKNIKSYIIVVYHPVTTHYHKTKNSIKEVINAVSKIDTHTIWLCQMWIQVLI